MKWGEVKTFTLQKMFAITGDALVENSTTRPYLKSMPQVANEALQLLKVSGKFVVKSHAIAQTGNDPGPVKKYDFSTSVSDFESFTREVYLLADGSYRQTYNYEIEAKTTLVLPADKAGLWTVYYNAFPGEITKDTDPEMELALEPKVAVLMPLYMASQLYKDDDIGMSTLWRNEFEIAREALYTPASVMTRFRW